MNVGVDIGGTKCRVGLVEDGRVVRKSEIAHARDISTGELIDNICTQVNELSGAVDGVGIGLPGVISSDRTTWVRVPNMRPQQRDARVAELVARRLGVRAVMENDANAAALGELRYGYGRDCDNIVLISLGTGIGGGIIINRRLYTGKNSAGEIGHMCIAEDGLLCGCGNRGCWEEYVSVKAIRRLSKQHFGKEMRSKQLLALAERGDARARRIFSEMGSSLGTGLRNMANIFDPDVIVITGGLSHTFPFMLEDARRVMSDSWLSTRIEVSRVPNVEILGPESLLHQNGF